MRTFLAFLLFFILISPAECKPLTAEKKLTPQEIRFKRLFNLNLPFRLGVISDKFEGSKDKVLILIKDHHCNYAVQKNIVEILKILCSRIPSLTSFFLEGASGDVDLSLFSSIEESQIKTDITSFLLMQGFISSVEFFVGNAKKNLKIFGVEDPDLYKENLDRFKAAMENLPELKENLKNLDEILTYIKYSVFNEALIKFLVKKEAYHNSRQLSLAAYMEYIRNKAITLKIDYEPQENFVAYLKLLKYENVISQPRIETATEAVIGELQQIISEEDFTELLKKNLNYKVGRISENEFYNGLWDIITLYRVPSYKYRGLDKYFKYLKLKNSIVFEQLYSEIAVVERKIKSKLLKDDRQKLVDDIIQTCEMMRDFVLLNSSLKGLKKYTVKNSLAFFQVKKITLQALLREIFKAEKVYEVLFDPKLLYKNSLLAESFYETALKRNEVIASNLLAKMEKQKENCAVALLGGFHLEGVVSFLKREKVSFMVIEPKLMEKQTLNYIRVMLNSKPFLLPSLPEEGTISQNKYLAPPVRLNNELLTDKISNSFDIGVTYLFFIAHILNSKFIDDNIEAKQAVEDESFYQELNSKFQNFIQKYTVGKNIANRIFLNKLSSDFSLKPNSLEIEGYKIKFLIGEKTFYLDKKSIISENKVANIKNYVVRRIEVRE